MICKFCGLDVEPGFTMCCLNAGQARIAQLEAALRSVLAAEWMVTCDWTSRDEREKVLGPAWALLPNLPTQSETVGDDGKCPTCGTFGHTSKTGEKHEP